MTHESRFHILGPLEVTVGDRPVRVPAGRQRVLLASLLVDANEIVPVDELVERVWGRHRPRHARGALHTCLTRLRHTLDRGEPTASAMIRTTAAGYGIAAPPHRLDHLRFQELLRDARSAAWRGDPAGESAALAEALSIWRGPPLTDVPSESLHREVVPKLTEQWLRAVERSNALDLALGRHGELIGELRALIRRHPFHERFWGQLMLALYRCGRQAEALQAYASVRERLRRELGVEPGRELRRLQLAILRDDPELAAM
ncbi:AfsR/SARP family transcriptional regulator [Actinomadura sp. NPDC047616]|uniref:AfsR/SARP family transcriptional regulator n=1 Tax=Actinomadura sp. NPDC047616 TaxID=3155914 RepID=UPI0033EF42B3